MLDSVCNQHTDTGVEVWLVVRSISTHFPWNCFNEWDLQPSDMMEIQDFGVLQVQVQKFILLAGHNGTQL